MKAIIINGEIYLKPRIPNDWKRPNGTFVLGYVNKTELHFDDGWREFQQPTFDPFNFKRTTNLITVNDIVTYEVVEMSQAEKDAYLEQIEDGETTGFVNTRKDDGEAEVIFIFKHLKRLHNEGTITTGQYRASENLLFDALLPMTYGLWEVTQTRLNAIPDPVNNTLLTILNTIRQRINDYITQN